LGTIQSVRRLILWSRELSVVGVWIERERERKEEPSIPRSLMLNTPLTVLLVLRCRILDSVGEAGASSMAESTLDKVDKGSCTSADMMDDDDGGDGEGIV